MESATIQKLSELTMVATWQRDGKRFVGVTSYCSFPFSASLRSVSDRLQVRTRGRGERGKMVALRGHPNLLHLQTPLQPMGAAMDVGSGLAVKMAD